MSETVVIVLWFREAEAAVFEDAFTREVRPLWEEYGASGKFLMASLARIVDGNREVAGAKGYLLVVETPSRDEHNAFDQDPRFVRFLKKAQKWQPEEPWVMLGDTLHRV
jgi:hypothetical protein